MGDRYCLTTPAGQVTDTCPLFTSTASVVSYIDRIEPSTLTRIDKEKYECSSDDKCTKNPAYAEEKVEYGPLFAFNASNGNSAIFKLVGTNAPAVQGSCKTVCATGTPYLETKDKCVCLDDRNKTMQAIAALSRDGYCSNPRDEKCIRVYSGDSDFAASPASPSNTVDQARSVIADNEAVIVKMNEVARNMITADNNDERISQVADVVSTMLPVESDDAAKVLDSAFQIASDMNETDTTERPAMLSAAQQLLNTVVEVSDSSQNTSGSADALVNNAFDALNAVARIETNNDSSMYVPEIKKTSGFKRFASVFGKKRASSVTTSRPAATLPEPMTEVEDSLPGVSARDFGRKRMCPADKIMSANQCRAKNNHLAVPFPRAVDDGSFVCCIDPTNVADIKRAECFGQIQVVQGSMVTGPLDQTCPSNSIAFDCGSAQRKSTTGVDYCTTSTESCPIGTCNMSGCLMPRAHAPLVNPYKCRDFIP